MIDSMGDASERREHPRVPLDANAPVVFLGVLLISGDDTLGPGRIVNIAEEGIFLGTDVELEMGRPVELQLERASGQCRAAGKVVWQSSTGVGVRFPDPDPEFRYFVRELAAADPDERLALPQTVTKVTARVD